MKRITIVTKDYTGLIADITEKLSNESINIESIEAVKVETTALVKIVSNNADLAYNKLVDSGFHVVSEAGVLIKLKDEAGALAKVSRELADNQIDIRGINMVEAHDGFTIVSLSCSDSILASEILKDRVI